MVKLGVMPCDNDIVAGCVCAAVREAVLSGVGNNLTERSEAVYVSRSSCLRAPFGGSPGVRNDITGECRVLAQEQISAIDYQAMLAPGYASWLKEMADYRTIGIKPSAVW